MSAVTWIGRYILNGTAIADEFHSLTPDGSPYLGISLRQYDADRETWIIEYLNVSNFFCDGRSMVASDRSKWKDGMGRLPRERRMR